MIPMFKPLLEEEEMNASRDSLEMGWLGMGSYVSQFEDQLKSTIDATDRYVAAVSTGTAGLHVGLLLARVTSGDEVIVSSFNCSADFQAITWTGADIVFCDCDNDSLTIDINKAEKLLSPRTKAIIIMDYGCTLCDYEAINDFSVKNGLRIIHDAAHSFGSKYKGKAIGGFSDICVFSYDPVKTITCLDGGAVVVRTEEELKYVQELRLLGMQQPASVMYKNQRAWTFDVEHVGFRYHMLNMHAAIGLAQLKKLDIISQTRVKACRYYSHLLADLPMVKTPMSSFDEINPFIYYIRVPERHRDSLRIFLKENNIDTGIHWQPGHWFSLWKNCRSGDLSVTDRVGKEIISLPLHSKMSLEIVEEISSKIHNYFEKEF